MAEIADNKIHHGHNLFLLRKQAGLKQETVALAYGCKQNRISQLENQETISDVVLEWFANYYGVTLEDIRDKEIELTIRPTPVYNNTFTEGSFSQFGTGTQTNNYNSGEVIMNLCTEKSQLYERPLRIEEQQKEELKKLLAKE